MGKAPEHRIFSSSGALRYRRKVPTPVDNQQPEPTDVKQEPKQQQQQTIKSRSRSSRSPPSRHFHPKPRQPKPQQPALLKQLLWKAKTVQPTQQQRDSFSNSCSNSTIEEEEDEEESFAREQRKERKLLASEAEELAVSKRKAAVSVSLPLSDAFVAESSSQETQSGSEDEAVFMPYGGLLPTVQPGAKWEAFRPEENSAGSGEETDGEEIGSPVLPSETVEPMEEETLKQQHGLEKEEMRRKQRQKYKQKQKQKRAAAKEKKRLQYQQKQEEQQSCVAEEGVRSTQDDGSTTVDVFHPPTNLSSEMDAGVCRAVLSQLKEVVPFIVVGDVACPMVPDDPHPVNAGKSDKCEVKTTGSEGAIVDFRQHVIDMLDRSKETQILYRESFVVEDSGFDAASSYDFFKSRFCEIQRSAGIVYY